MMRFECLLERTAEVREKDQMKIRKFEVHAGRTGSVSRLLPCPSDSPRSSQGRPGKNAACNQHTQLTEVRAERAGGRWLWWWVGHGPGVRTLFFNTSPAPPRCTHIGKPCLSNEEDADPSKCLQLFNIKLPCTFRKTKEIPYSSLIRVLRGPPEMAKSVCTHDKHFPLGSHPLLSVSENAVGLPCCFHHLLKPMEAGSALQPFPPWHHWRTEVLSILSKVSS